MEVQTKQDFLTIETEALNQINAVIEAQPQADLFLRVYVQGGCGGISYGMAIDSRLQEGDAEYVVDGLKVVVDRISHPYVENVTVAFDNSSEKPGFRITNPNPEILASVGGGCGSGSCSSGSCGTGGGCGSC